MIKKHEVKIAAIINTAKKVLDELATLRSASDEVLDCLRYEELTADAAKHEDEIRALDEAACSISSAESALGTAIAFLRVVLDGEILETVDVGKRRTAKRAIAATS